MENLALQLRNELTERAKNSESCKNYLLDWVMNEFRNGVNPVVIKCTDSDYGNQFSEECRERIGYKQDSKFINLFYEDGRHYAKGLSGSTKVDITDLPDAQRYAANGKDESDKSLFLKDAGFHVTKYWKYGMGHIIEITY